MRIRIALGAAMAATFVVSNIHHSGVSHGASTNRELVAYRRPLAGVHGGSLGAQWLLRNQAWGTSALETAGQLWPTGHSDAATPAASATLHPLPTRLARRTAAVAQHVVSSPPPPVAPPVTPVPAPPPPPTDATSTATATWACIRTHESGDRYNSPTAPSGAYGIIESTWLSLGYGGWPYEASATLQDAAALTLYNEYGWQPWSTRYVCGL